MFDYEDGDQSVIIKATNTKNGLWYEREFIIRVTENGTSVDNTSFPEPKINLNDNNTISVNTEQPLHYEIFSVLGAKMAQGNLNSGNNTIQLSNNNQSIVLLKLSFNHDFKTFKIMLK